MSAAAATGGRPGRQPGRQAVSLSALLMLGGLTLFWGINWPIMKVAVDALPVLAFRTFCLAIAGTGMLAIAAAARLPLRVPPAERRPLLLVAFANTTMWHVCSAFALAHLPAGRAAILAYTMPLWASLLAVPMLGERLRWTTLAGLAVGLAGMALLVAPDWARIVAAPLGIVAILVAAFGWALGTVGFKAVRWTNPTLVVAGWQYLLGGVPVALGALWHDAGFAYGAVPWPAWAAAIYSATLPLIFCQWAFFRLVKAVPASVATIGTLAIPVVGVVSGGWMLGERIGPEVLGALVLVVAALVLVLVVPALGRGERRLAPARTAR
jgi:drug/metabolite transporter (DMT)-like permease